MFPATPVVFVQSTGITSIKSFIYGLLFRTQLGRFSLDGIRGECVWGWYGETVKRTQESLCFPRRKLKHQQNNLHIYFLTPHINLQQTDLPVFFWTEDCSAAAHAHQTCSPTLKAEPLVQKLSPHFQKATLLSAFLTWSQFPSILASLSEPGPRQQLGVEEKKKKTSQVKFKDVFLLEAWLRCHKPRETFSCSTFFMVSLRVSSLPFSLHLGSRVTYCCTGCGPQPAGHCGVAGSSLSAPNRSPPLPQQPKKALQVVLGWLSLVEDPSENPPPGRHYLSSLSPPSSNNTLPTHSELMANSNQL